MSHPPLQEMHDSREALAEWLHRKVRRFMGFGSGENLSVEELIDEKYRGIRPAAGYPACPDHTEKQALWDLLDVEAVPVQRKCPIGSIGSS